MVASNYSNSGGLSLWLQNPLPRTNQGRPHTEVTDHLLLVALKRFQIRILNHKKLFCFIIFSQPIFYKSTICCDKHRLGNPDETPNTYAAEYL